MTRAADHIRRLPRSPFDVRRSTLAPAFTFIEVLFAIIILGIGSIMLAGMLPVAIKQSSDTRNEITGRAVAEAGFAHVRAAVAVYNSLGDSNALTNPSTAALPSGMPIASVSGRVVPLTHAVINLAANVGTSAAPEELYAVRDITGSRLFSSDRRFQWTAFYARDPNTAAAKLVVLATRLQNVQVVQEYGAATLTQPASEPLLMNATIVDGGPLDSDRVTLTATGSPAARWLDAADAGAFLIVATQNASAAANPLRNNGRVFRLGNRRFDLESTPTTARVFELQPGYDLPRLGEGPDRIANNADDEDLSLGTGTATQVWLVGRGLRDPTLAYDATTNPPLGPVQDIAVLQVTLPVAP